MNLDTPLTEVAHILPAETAARLLHLSPHRVCIVLTCIRVVVTQWEESGVVMDPVTFGVVIDSVVLVVMGLEELAWKASS